MHLTVFLVDIRVVSAQCGREHAGGVIVDVLG
jgi:hypothetical protein